MALVISKNPSSIHLGILDLFLFRGFSIFPDVTTVLPIMAWDQAKKSQVVTSGRWAWSGSWFSHGKIAIDLVICSFAKVV